MNGFVFYSHKPHTCKFTRQLKGQWEVRVSRYKLLHIEWINNEVLQYSTENYIQCPGINRKGKE